MEAGWRWQGLFFTHLIVPFPCPPHSRQGFSFHLAAVLLSLAFITYVEHGKWRAQPSRLGGRLAGAGAGWGWLEPLAPEANLTPLPPCIYPSPPEAPGSDPQCLRLVKTVPTRLFTPVSLGEGSAWATLHPTLTLKNVTSVSI